MQIHKIIVSDIYNFLELLPVLAELAEIHTVDFGVHYAPTGVVIELSPPYLHGVEFVCEARDNPDINEDFLIFYTNGSSVHLSEVIV